MKIIFRDSLAEITLGKCSKGNMLRLRFKINGNVIYLYKEGM